MAIPTLDQTEGIWITRTNGRGYYYVQEIFAGNTPVEQFHRTNCHMLITRGSLEPENNDGLEPSQRSWDEAQRYCQVHF